MALQFVLGDLSVDKKRAVIERLVAIKQAKPHAKIYYLVPEHLKFDMEQLLLTHLERLTQQKHAAILDIQVVSFSRLAWFMASGTLEQQSSLSKVGLTMLVRQLLLKHQAQLTVYRGQIQFQGFVEKLVTLFEELYEGNILPEDLTLESVAHSPLEVKRLEELALLYQAFREEMATKQFANFQTYAHLQQQLEAQQSFEDHYLVIDHHYYFNAHQLGAIVEFVRYFQEVWITLPLTSAQAHDNQWNPLIEMQRATYQQLRLLCQNAQLPVLTDWEITIMNSAFDARILQMAHAYRDGYQYGVRAQAALNAPYQVWQCDTIQTELRHVSNQIHELVTQKGYRYRDILIVARDMDRYQLVVEPIFAHNEIPLFFDHETKMAQHPLMLWLEACLHLPKYRWRYQEVMRVLKSPLFVPSHKTIKEHEADVHWFENIVLANGYFGYRLTNLAFEWHIESVEKTQQQAVHTLRQWMVSTLQPMFDFWKKKSISGAKAAQWLYELIEKTGVKQQLEAMRDAAIEAGNIDESRRHEQIWQVFSATLDEFYRLYENEFVDYALFCELILAGLSEGTYHIIPPTLDQVTFTSMESPQAAPYKICFIVGANEHVLPKKRDFQSLLSRYNREALRETLLPYQYLVQPSEQANNQEYLLTYQLLLNATDGVYISFATNLDNQTVTFSPYLKQITDAFGVETRVFTSEMPLQFSESFGGKMSAQLSPVLQTVRHYYEAQQQLPERVIQLIHLLGEKAWHLIQKAFHFNALPNNLSSETALQLFGKNISASVSKIEQYYQDPYSHFLLYGLKLQERATFDANPARMGDYYHDFLEKFMTELKNRQLSLAELDWTSLFQEIQQQLLAEPKYMLFDSHARMQAIKHQLDSRLQTFIQLSQAQQQIIPMHSHANEVLFGVPNGLPGFEYSLPSGGKLLIRGKIDRIDTVAGQFLQVIDYKSSARQFNLVDAYYGLDLQILTYLSVAMQHFDKAPIGAFYQTLAPTYQSGTKETLHSASFDSLLEENRLKGILTADDEHLRAISEQAPSVYPAKFTKSGYSSSTPFYDKKDLQTILKYTHWMFQQAAEQMQAGHIALQPFKTERYTPSLQTQYRVITGFDATENYQVYRNKTIVKKDVLDQMKTQLGERGDAQDD
ncbi:MAG: PD-(D/E)XK nuclease family protein [Aerococcaceae bacterium]|nr:PD-(D/E)XK nuclease family protein [Aerococcaceae bacterium]